MSIAYQCFDYLLEDDEPKKLTWDLGVHLVPWSFAFDLTFLELSSAWNY
jgi:hypothetical protein